jgi:hypothetical protein
MAADRSDHYSLSADDAKSDPVQRVDVITGVKRGRSWLDTGKERIAAEGVVISDVARRNLITPQELFG